MNKKSQFHTCWLLASLNFIALCLLPLGAQAAIKDYDGTFDSVTATGAGFTTATNWIGGVAPASSLATDIARFNKSSYTYSTLVNAGYSLNGLIFGDGATATADITISINGAVGQQLRIGGSGIVMNANSGNATINKIQLGANQAWTNNSANLLSIVTLGNFTTTTPYTNTLGGSGRITFTSTVSDNTAGTTALNVFDATVTLSAANTFTGGLTLNSGTILAGNANALGGAANVVTINGGTLAASSATARTLAQPTTIGGDFTLGQASGGTGALTLSGSMDLGGATRQITLDNAADTISGIISNGGLTKAGNGTLTLSATNTYAGGTINGAGTIKMSNDGALGTGILTMNGGVLGTTAGATLTNDVVLAADGEFNNANNFSLNGVISGSKALIHSGSASLTINNTNTYAGGTTNTLGIIQFGSARSLGTGPLTLNEGTTIQCGLSVGTFTNQIILAGNANMGGIQNLVISGVISGGFSLTNANSAQTTFSGNNTFSGGITVKNGTAIAAGNDNGFGTGTVNFLNGGQISVSGNHTIANNMVLNGNISGNALSAANEFTGQISGSGNMSINGFAVGTFKLSGDNTNWSGNWKFNGENRLQLNHIHALGTGTTITFNTPGADNKLRGVLESLVTLTGANALPQAVNLGTATSGWTNNPANIRTTADLELTNVVSGDASAPFIKSGAGTLILAGVNTYAGPTTVSNGTLLVNGDSSAVTNTVVVTSGATLGGMGTLGGAVTFDDGSLAVFTNGSPLTLSSSLTIPGNTVVHVNLTNDVPIGIYALATYNVSGSSGSFNSVPVIDSGTFAAGTTNYLTTGTGSVALHVEAVSTMSTTPTNIVFSVSGSNLSLTWPGSHLGWYAQSNAVNLADTNYWFNIPGSDTVTNLDIVIDPAMPNVFYRLRLP